MFIIKWAINFEEYKNRSSCSACTFSIVLTVYCKTCKKKIHSILISFHPINPFIYSIHPSHLSHSNRSIQSSHSIHYSHSIHSSYLSHSIQFSHFIHSNRMKLWLVNWMITNGLERWLYGTNIPFSHYSVIFQSYFRWLNGTSIPSIPTTPVTPAIPFISSSQVTRATPAFNTIKVNTRRKQFLLRQCMLTDIT